jgi:hypothetical protein
VAQKHVDPDSQHWVPGPHSVADMVWVDLMPPFPPLPGGGTGDGDGYLSKPLQDRLCSHHQVTDFQQVEKMCLPCRELRRPQAIGPASRDVGVVSYYWTREQSLLQLALPPVVAQGAEDNAR